MKAFYSVEGEMLDDLEIHQTRSSSDLWSEICSSLPSQPSEGQETDDFTDSFQPRPQEAEVNDVTSITSFNPWAPMADSATYIANLERRLKRIKGQSQEVTSRDMLRTLTQAKKECWDRFLHDMAGPDPFEDGSDIDESALEHLKRWLQPDKVAISAEELEHLLLPKQHEDQNHQECKEEEESQAPEK